MKTAVLYNDDGQIVRVRTGPAGGVIQTAENSGFSYLYFDEVIDASNKYVDNDVLVDMPEQPSSWHEFDYVTKAWALSLSFGKQDKWRDIKQSREDQEFGTFDWNGFTFDCDEVSQRRIQGAVQLAALDNTTEMDWTLADNSSQTFNSTELQQVGQALGAHVNACHVKARDIRAQIDAATTEAELDAISW